MNPKVSIIIPFYNCGYIDQAIQSALNQRYPNFEIIVIDDGSTKHVEKIKPFLKHIRYTKKQNGGTASALNEGIRLAKGEYISWLSSDDMYHPSKLSEQMMFMMTTNRLISFTNYYFLYNNTIYPVTLYFSNEMDVYRRLLEGCPVNGCTVMMKKELVQTVGGFDETLQFTHDYDLWIRIVLAGYDFAFSPQSNVTYRIHEQMGTKKYGDSIPQEIEKIRLKYAQQLNEYINRKAGK